MDNTIDTSELLTEEDQAIMQTIEIAKKAILAHFKIEDLVKEITGLINKSELVSFVDTRSAKFINPRRPTFSLKVDKIKSIETLKPTNFKNEQEEMTFLSEVIYQEIVRNFTDFIIKVIRQDDSIKEIVESNPSLKESQQDVLNAISSGIFTTIFGMNADLKNYAVTLEYFV